PSHFDPFPNAIIEASAAGLPSVAIDNGSRREAIHHGHTGLLVPEASARLLANALQLILSRASIAQEMGRAARALCGEVFSWDHVVRRIRAQVVSCPSELCGTE